MQKLVFFLTGLMIACSLFAQKTDTLFYAVVNLGKTIGENKAWKTAAGEYHYQYYYNDRGRGVVVNATVNTGSGGKIEKLNSSGLDYYKAPFTDAFQRQHDSLVSQYNSVRKTEPDSGQQFVYYGVPAGIEIFIKSLLAAPGNRSATMGGDTALLKPLQPFTLAANGKNIKLFLCNIDYGKGSGPSFTWMDKDHHFFADVSGWSCTIKKGYEKMADHLHELQEQNAIPFYKKIYKQLSDTLPAKLAIKNVALFDAPHATTTPNATVLMVNGVVTATGSTGDIDIPAGFTVIDGSGKMMLPGLWDTHGHYDKDQGIGYLSGGITHVRDMGNMTFIKQVQRNIRLHNFTGPDISYLSGFIDKDDEFHGPVGKLVNSKAAAVQAVNEYFKAGYNQIKIYSSIDTAWVKAMCTEAHRLKMRVAGHIPVHMTASKAVTDGYDELTHMNMLMLNFFPDTIDTRRNRFKPVGRQANTINLESPAVKAFIDLLVKKKTVVEPTIGLFNGMFNSFPGDTAPMYKPVVQWVPAAQRQGITVDSFVDDTAYAAAYKESFKRMMQMLQLLYRNGLTLLAGTDGGAQLALHHELETFVKAGIPDNEVLKIACYNPTAVFGIASSYGNIKKGRVADFILVDGNPATHISDIRKVFLVVTNRSMFYPKKLYKYYDWSYYY